MSTATKQQLLASFPDTCAADWRRRRGAWIHKDAVVSTRADVCGGIFRAGEFRNGDFHDGVFRGGEFCGGEFYGGTFRGGGFFDGTFYDGRFYGGTFYGGRFYGGTFYGGEFHDGIFHGGFFRGGEFHGGKFLDGIFHDGVFRGGGFHGGTFRGGTFRGGEYYAGTFRDGWYDAGVFHDAPPLLVDMLPWPVTIGAPGKIAVGCMCLSLRQWRSVLAMSPRDMQTRVVERVATSGEIELLKQLGGNAGLRRLAAGVLLPLAASWLHLRLGPDKETPAPAEE